MTDEIIFETIEKDIKGHDIVLFMKGNANFPQCGFSAAVVQILRKMGVQFKDINVLLDQDIREGVKKYTNWPTIPQLYIKGEFIGGCDIIREMYETGELEEHLQEKGLK